MATAPAPVAPPDTLDQRVSRLEGAYEHLATKADLARLETRLTEKISQLETRLYRSFWWMTVTLMAGIITAIGVATWVILNALPQ